MAVKLRLRRMGKKKRPFYRIVATDMRAPRDGRFIEMLGTYDPLVKPFKVDLEESRILYWLKNGAQPTQTVQSLLKNKGLWLKWDLIKKGADDAKISEEFAKWQLIQSERSKRLAEKAALKSDKKQAETESVIPEAEVNTVESIEAGN